jgi:prepilin-type N-terminal cleavage/methylation domain-containing protein
MSCFSPRTRLAQTESRQAFSLVELLIALSIVLILTGMVAGVFQVSVEDAKNQVFKANQRALRRALRDFYNDHGRFPYNGQDDFGNIVAFLDPGTSELVNGVHDGPGHYPRKRTRYLVSIPVDPTLTDALPLWALTSFDNDADGVCDEDPIGGGDQDGDGHIDEDPPDVRDIYSINETGIITCR